MKLLRSKSLCVVSIAWVTLLPAHYARSFGNNASPSLAAKKVHVKPNTNLHSVFVGFDAQGKNVIAGCEKKIVAWNIVDGRSKWTITRDPAAESMVSPDGKIIVETDSLGATSKIKVWSTENGKELMTDLVDDLGSNIVFGPNPGEFSAIRDGTTVQIWKYGLMGAGRDRVIRRNVTDRTYVLSPDLKRAVVGVASKKDQKGGLFVWDLEANKAVTAVDPMGHYFFSPCGKRIIDPNNKCSVSIWDARTGHQTKLSLLMITRCVISPNGKWLATSFGEKNQLANDIAIWEVPSGRKMLTLSAVNIGAFAFSPQNDMLVVATAEAWYVWSLTESASSKGK